MYLCQKHYLRPSIRNLAISVFRFSQFTHCLLPNLVLTWSRLSLNIIITISQLLVRAHHVLDPILHSLYGYNLLNTHTSLEGTLLLFFPLYRWETGTQRDWWDLDSVWESEVCFFNHYTLLPPWNGQAEWVKPEMGKIFLGREGCYLAWRLMRWNTGSLSDSNLMYSNQVLFPDLYSRTIE